MILIQTPAARILALDVPEGIGQSFINDGYIRVTAFPTPFKSKLPPGNWKLLGERAEVTEEMAKGILDPHGIYAVYKDYGFNDNDFLSSALESFHSLLAANNITNNNLLLIEIK